MRRAFALVVASLAPALAVGQTTAVVGERQDGSSGWLVGRVCEDRDGDGVCGFAEPGIARARVVLSDGSFAVTDEQGRYHIAAVPTRRVEIQTAARSDGVRDTYGRILVKLDQDSLGRDGTVVGGPRRVVELGPAALQQVDFPVSFARKKAGAIGSAPAAGPRGTVQDGSFRFKATGRTAPGHLVHIEGVDATVSADGVFAGEVGLVAGKNLLAISDLSPEGDLIIYRQLVSVVQRERGGVLFIPGEPQRVVALSLPRIQAAPATEVSVGIQAAFGTEVSLGGHKVAMGPDGEAKLELTLARGENALELRVVEPGKPPIVDRVLIQARGMSFVSALLSLELGFEPRRKVLSFLGRGTASAQVALGEFDLSAGLDLDVGDVLVAVGRAQTSVAADPMVLLRPREPLSFERAIDPELYPPVTGDDGISGSANPAGMRLWARLQHARFGEVRFGSIQADLGGVEVGRYQRSLFGGLIDAKVPLGPVTLRAMGFGAPPLAATGEAQPAPAHDEFTGTGGSLFFLRHVQVIPGSEQIRVVLRDGLTGLAVEERALVRQRDYEIDYDSGRVLLSRPLPINDSMNGPLMATPLQGRHPALLVDYEFQSLSDERRQILGGRAGLSVGKYLELYGTALKEHRLDPAEPSDADYLLFGAHGKGRLGPVTLVGEFAQSEGTLFSPSGDKSNFSLSDSGGLSFMQAGRVSGAPARAWSVRASMSEDSYGAQLWARGRDAGFSDGGSQSQAMARQFGGLARLSLGRFELFALYDDRQGADPRDPFGNGTVAARDGVLRASVKVGAGVTLSAEGTFASLQMPEQIGDDPLNGGRVGVGARLDFEVTPELSLNASHHQKVYGYGEGRGALDDSFSAIGATWHPKDDLGLSVRGGWGPGVGTQVQVGAERAAENEVSYGLWTSDVDGPCAGQTQVVSGARRHVDETAEVFVEDELTRDLDSLRMGRAIGMRVAPVKSLSITAGYERGVRLPFSGEPALLRDTGSARVSWLVAGVRLGALAEVGHERGTLFTDAPVGSGTVEESVDRWRLLGGVSLDARPAPWLGLGARFTASKTRNHGVDESYDFEGYAAASLRLEPWVLLVSYTLIDQLPPPELGGSLGRELEHLVSVRPSVVLFDHLRLGAGLHAGFFRIGGNPIILAVSLRPAVRIVGGLEVAVEGARRSSAPQGESLDALRVEVAYWFNGLVGAAVGYNLHGYSGIGVDRESGRSDRVYLRLEAAY